MSATTEQPGLHPAEREARRAYGGEYYNAHTVSMGAGAQLDYFERQLAERLAVLRKISHGKILLDLCCGPGMHLNAPDATHRLSIGLDITRTLLCLGLGGRSPGNYFVEASARSLPLASGSLDVVTAFASLPYVPHHAEWTAEIARVLRPGGHALLDLGNPRSLNAIVSRAEPGSSQLMVPPIGAQLRALRAAGLQILWRRCHQILPYWGNKPRWLRPLLHPFWKRVMQRRLFGRMLDEWISSLPLLNRFAFRHLVLCRKPGGELT